MIKSFRDRGIERFFRQEDSRRINPKQGPRIRRMLDLIDQSMLPEEVRKLTNHVQSHSAHFTRSDEGYFGCGR